MCRFDPGSGYEDSLIIAWLWGFLILAGCTKGVLFREKLQRKVKNPAKFCVWLQGLRTQNDGVNLPLPAPSPMSNRTGLAKNLHLLHYLHQWLFDIPLFSTSCLSIKSLWIWLAWKKSLIQCITTRVQVAKPFNKLAGVNRSGFLFLLYSILFFGLLLPWHPHYHSVTSRVWLQLYRFSSQASSDKLRVYSLYQSIQTWFSCGFLLVLCHNFNTYFVNFYRFLRAQRDFNCLRI